ncbi:hypothetical protein B0H19DRAFT_1077907 [Mycena capillaripes]|nr:hypothetical protein B0H19DRAFT_1077907 [Mycena capillaripes]
MERRTRSTRGERGDVEINWKSETGGSGIIGKSGKGGIRERSSGVSARGDARARSPRYPRVGGTGRVMTDPTVRKLVAEAEEFGFQTGGTSFGADAVTKLERDTLGTSVHAIGIYTAPQQMSPAQFHTNFEAWIDKFLALPVVQKNFVKFTMLVPKTALDIHLQSLGLSAATPTQVNLVEAETWDGFLKIHFSFEQHQVAQDPEARKLMASGVKEFSFHAESCFFSSEIVSKMEN